MGIDNTPKVVNAHLNESGKKIDIMRMCTLYPQLLKRIRFLPTFFTQTPSSLTHLLLFVPELIKCESESSFSPLPDLLFLVADASQKDFSSSILPFSSTKSAEAVRFRPARDSRCDFSFPGVVPVDIF